MGHPSQDVIDDIHEDDPVDFVCFAERGESGFFDRLEQNSNAPNSSCLKNPDSVFFNKNKKLKESVENKNLNKVV